MLPLQAGRFAPLVSLGLPKVLLVFRGHPLVGTELVAMFHGYLLQNSIHAHIQRTSSFYSKREIETDSFLLISSISTVL